MIVYRASWILPISRPPIREGWVAVDHGSIVALGDAHAAPTFPDAEVQPLPGCAILPGLVNAHTHLELSWMERQVPPQARMSSWAASLMALRRAVGAEPNEPIRTAVASARAAGTSLVGDVTNTFAAYDVLADSDLSACVFRELLGFTAPEPRQLVAEVQAQIDGLTPMAWLRPSIVPHAPYSVSPALFAAIADASRGRIVSVHLGESAEEIEFLRSGTGPWRDLLEQLGVWNPAWTPPACGPVEYLRQFGLVNETLVAVHGVQLTDAELRALADAGASLVTCPRSNRWVGAGDPPIERFYASGVRVAIGTDSLASVHDLNIFNELAAARALAPQVPASRLLDSATRSGAQALGFEDELGSIEVGKRAELIAVAVPDGTTDVEEYLVGGALGDVRWLAR